MTPNFHHPRRAQRAACRLLAVALLAAVSRAQQPPAPAGERGVLVYPAVLRINPDSASASLGAASPGREVVVLEHSHDWVKVFSPTSAASGTTGWMLNGGVVSTATPNGDRILFGAAQIAEDRAAQTNPPAGAASDAMLLYARVREYFPSSPLAGEALYRAADIRWQIEYHDVMSLPSAHNQDPMMRPRIDEDSMREVIKKYPHSQWADLAAYRLIDNKLCGDWLDQSKCPERESGIYEKYAREHPQSPKAAEALYNAAWRQAALIEIYQTEHEQGRSQQARSRALALAGQVASEFPESDWATRAQRLAFLVQQDIPTYGRPRE